MSNAELYRANLDAIEPLISRNRENNIRTIEATSFWINDVEQANSTHIIEFSTDSKKNWLKFEQAHGEQCTLFPIDGDGGVFQDPPPVLNDFKLNGKNVGGCDFLLVNAEWLFTEFKVEATSQSILQIQENREKASLQLARTLTYFKENTPASVINVKNTICRIVTPTFYPKISKIPIAMTSKFLQKHRVKLEENTLDDVIKL